MNSDQFAKFDIGARVLTVDGILGTVVARHDGPTPQAESYEVVLDSGLGGGEYAVRDLSPAPATTASTDAPVVVPGEQVGLFEGEDGVVASQDYPELAEILVERPPLEHSEPLMPTGQVRLAAITDGEPHGGQAKTACLVCDGTGHEVGLGKCATCGGSGDLGDFLASSDLPRTPTQDEQRGADEHVLIATSALWDRILEPMTRYLDKQNPGAAQGDSWAANWCVVRKGRKCFYPKELDVEATARAGHSVWKPHDRGICPRDSWEAQAACPLSWPSANTGLSDAMPDSMIGWRPGQRPYRYRSVASKDSPYVFEFTAAWSDVREKARQIRASGGVRVVSVVGDKDSGRTVVAEVRGDTSVYLTEIVSEPGRLNVAMWSCTCPWATYSWGRSGKWKKYEGRMCSHALAVVYEAQTYKLVVQPEAPEWSALEPSRDIAPAASLRPVETDPYLHVAPAVRIASSMLRTGTSHQEVTQTFGERITQQAKVLDFNQNLQALVNGQVRNVREVVTETNTAILDDGTQVRADSLLYPHYHPTLGLTASLEDSIGESDEGHEAILHDEPEPALPVAYAETDDVLSDYTEYGADTYTEQALYPDTLPDIEDPPDEDVPTIASRQWLMQDGGGSDDIAQAAREHLAKSAVKTFSPAEQKEIIDEGEGVIARNFSDLQVAGTFYEMLGSDDDDDGEDLWL